ncbi:MAG: sugar ABC transporter substrate-binding protein [Clostridia bacterium]|nr:sugar ABC transporter substrate-binding protein [Clostridia bacterium]
MIQRIKLKAIFFVLLLLSLAGCSFSNEKDTTKVKEDSFVIGVVTKSSGSEYWMSVYAGLNNAAKDHNVEVVILSPESEEDKKIQKKMILDLLLRKVDALAVSPVDSYDNEDYISMAKEMEIPVYAYDTSIEDCEVPYIGIDNEKAGYELAKCMAQKLDEKGDIAVIAGSLIQSSHALRLQGFERGIKEYPDMDIQVIKSGYSNEQITQQDLDQLLIDHPKVKGIMTTSAVTALGITEATKGTGIEIVSVDAQEDALLAVEDGRILALAAQPGYDIGYDTISYIVEARDSKKQEKDRILNVEILTKENVSQYRDENSQIQK